MKRWLIIVSIMLLLALFPFINAQLPKLTNGGVISCQDIMGSSDSDFCSDATGGGINGSEVDPFWSGNQSSYYLKSNPFSFYNFTSWNNPYGYLNTTAEPLWSANYTLFNSTWSSIFNLTYNDAWKYVTNNSFYPYTSNPFGYLNTSADSFAGNYSTFLTHINWGQATNGTLMLASNWNATNTSYYLQTNPFSFYNITSWNNPYAYWNLTFATFNKSYADTLYQPIGTYIDQTYGNATYYLKTNPFSFYNSTNFPYTSLSNFTNNMGFYNLTSWNNPYTYFNLTNFPNYANVYLNTSNQFSFYNSTTLSAYLNTSNQFSYFNLTNFPNYANVYLNTSNQFSYFNATSFGNYARIYLNTTNQFGYINLTTLAGNETDPKAYNGSLYLSTNPSNYITNATMNKSVSCSNIFGSPDTDFCTDQTGAGSGVNFESVKWVQTDYTNSLAGTGNYNVTNLTITLSANSFYLIDCDLLTDSAAATTGIQLRVNTTGSPTSVRVVYSSPLSATTIEMLSGTNIASNTLADLGSGTAGVTAVTQLDSYVVTSGSTSIWGIEMKSEVAGSQARIRSGSFCRAMKVT